VDSSTWPSQYPPSAKVFVSALGTTVRQAGGFQNQRKIDYDLNVALAKAAQSAGATIYALISTSGANSTSRIPYSRMKGELDDAVSAMGFEHCIIVKPGLLVGERQDSRPGEFAARKVATWLGGFGDGRWKDSWAQDAHVVARATVAAVLQVRDGSNVDKVRVLDQKEIVRLGKS